MVASASIQTRLISSFLGDGLFLTPNSANTLHRLFHIAPGRRHVSMQMSRALSGLTNLLFNRRYRRISKETFDSRESVFYSSSTPIHIQRPPYIESMKPPGIASAPEIHDQKELKCMRASGNLAAQVLQYAGTLPSITTDEIDQAVHQMIVENGAYTSPLGYGGFRKSDGDKSTLTL